MASLQSDKNGYFYAVIYDKELDKHRWEALGTKDKKLAKVLFLEHSERPQGNLWSQFREKYLDYCKINLPQSWKTSHYAIESFHCHIHVRDIKDITSEMLEIWKSQLTAEKKKPQTINRYLVVINTMLSKAVEWKYLNENPAESVDPIKIQESYKDAYTPEEIQAIREAAVGDLQKVFVELAFLTGGRRKEMNSLQFKDVLWDRDLIRVGPSKNGEYRYIPLHSDLKTILERWKRKTKGEYILSETGKKTNIWIHSRRFKAILKRAFKALGRPVKGSLHLCRHTWVTYSLLSGINPKLVQKWAGHKDFRTTDRVYTHIMDDAGKEQINLLKI